MATLNPTELLFRNQRRQLLRRSPTHTGIESLTVEPGETPDQWRLLLRFIPPAPAHDRAVEQVAEPLSRIPGGIEKRHVEISLSGGRRAADVRLEAVVYPHQAAEYGLEPPDPDTLILLVRKPAAGRETADADLPAYTLELVDIERLDPFFSQVSFRFEAGIFSEVIAFDPPRKKKDPRPLQIDYLAKDYDSFRNLMLNQMSALIPSWEERNPTDLGVAMVEVLAYAADYLSYYQDAVATEAYLETARRRVSVRRHVRLLDYFLDEGCNARVWVQIRVGDDQGQGVTLPAGTRLLTTSSNVAPVLIAGTEEERQAMLQSPQVFETMHEQTFFESNNQKLQFYTWGSANFTLRRGTRNAALEGHFPHLKRGDVLVFEQALDSATGQRDDADPRQRHAVRLATEPRMVFDSLRPGAPEQAAEGESDSEDPGTPITQIEWFDDDALPFELPVASEIGNRTVRSISVAWANIVLADHGATEQDDALPIVPPDGVAYTPTLSIKNLTFRVPYDADSARQRAATWATRQRTIDALPALTLYSYPAHSVIPREQQKPPRGTRWRARRDLLASGRFAREFVVETETDFSRQLRFGIGSGDGLPQPGSRFVAVYRVGNGPRGNIGPEAIAHLVLSPELASELAQRKVKVWGACNYLAAVGGTGREPLEGARLNAPPAAHLQQRCVTRADYVEVAERHPEVFAAACELRWTGSWETAYLYLQRRDGRSADEAFLKRLDGFMKPFLITGYDLETRPPRWVPLRIAMTVRVRQDSFREVVHEKLRQVFGTGRLIDGEPAFFHPDRFTFGQPLYLSHLVAAALEIDGVLEVDVTRCHRWGETPRDELKTGMVKVGPLEIARVHNDLNAPQHGTIGITMRGGR